MPALGRLAVTAARAYGFLSGVLRIDEFFEYVTLLLPGNGTNGAQNNTFLDSSTNNFSITRNGNTTQGTFSPFSQTGWGNYFNGSSDIRASSNAAFSPGTGNFTFEAWINPLSWATTAPFFVVQTTGGLWIGKNGSNFVVRAANVADQLQTATIPSTNQWTHIVAVRSGTTLSLFFNGTRVATTTNSYNFAQGGASVGSDADPGTVTYYTGYISNARLVKGTAVYDPTASTLTVPTTPLTSISGTSLLTCQSNRFIDNSSNAFAITVNGSPSIQAFSPFNPTAAWSAATNGGSGYFDGSGDYLAGGANAALALPGVFTFECWFYPNSFDQVSSIGDTIFSTLAVGSFTIGRTDSSTGNLWGIAETAVAWRLTSSTLPTNKAWNHIVAVRNSGNTLSLFLNGTRIATTTLSTSFGQNGFSIGSDNGVTNSFADGFFADVRLVKGTAVYDPTASTLTVPTAPLTAITNTSLLLNYTNAGIYDATSKNDLETVGNAQISTTQSKFGGSSIYFDGTGDYCNTGPTVNLEFGSGDFTIEMWIYPAVTSRMAIYHGSSGTDWSIGIDYNSQKFNIWASSNGTTWNLINADPGGNGIGTTTISTNTWTHVAFVRSGTTWQTYINGTRDINLTGISGSIVNRATSAKSIGKWWFSNGVGNPGVWNGYMQDVRITKGVARYTANFTAPTAAFPIQ